jgi:hypothetical protein
VTVELLRELSPAEVGAWLSTREGEEWSRAVHQPISHVRQRRGTTDPAAWFVPFAEVYGGTKEHRNPNTHPWDQSRWRPRNLNPLLDPTRGGTP